MENHLQGVALLILLLLGLWAFWRYASPVLDDAIGGSDGAIVAVSGDDSEIEARLSTDEVAELQAALAAAGYDPGPVDGILGELTRTASAEARFELDLPDSSYRELIAALDEQATDTTPEPASLRTFDPSQADLDPNGPG